MPSIVPTSFRPKFVGGSLGSGINSSMLRKTQLAQFWLDQQYAGVTIKQVQGSPSYSGASAGIHGGPGDFQDFVLVDFLGRTPATKVWVACSAMFRLLDCLSYVRGNDVNQDGRKDDTFAQHIHVGDREGGGKVWAAALQISQYLAHQNGLVGGHPDLEATVTNPLTLATYSDAGFVDRYQSLTSHAFKLDVHTEPIQEDDMAPHTFMKWSGHPAVFVTDQIKARWIQSPEELADANYLTRTQYGNMGLPVAGPGVVLVRAYDTNPKLRTDVPVTVVGRKSLIGVIEGDVPTGWAEAK